MGIDELDHTRLTDFLEQCERAHLASGILDRMQGDLRCHLA